MSKTLLTTKEFLSMPSSPVIKITIGEFLKKYWITDCNDCNGWKFNGKFTTNIEEAKRWYNENE